MISRYKNIFLDRDGVINEIIFRDGIVSSPWKIDEFELTRDIKQFVTHLHQNKKNVYVVSNQPDISRGGLVQDELNLMDEMIQEELNIDNISYCKHDDHHICECRKPKPGLILSLIRDYRLEKKDSVIIGDSWKDILAGKNAGIDTIYLKTSYNHLQNRQKSYKFLCETTQIETILSLI